MLIRTIILLAATAAAPFNAAARDSPGTGVANAPDPPIASCESAYAELPYGTILDLLDPDAPIGRREAALAAYERLAAMERCPEFGYTLGQLYRHGADLPGNLVEQDVERARALIRPMAEDGHLDAYADLAEMEMRHANSREMMKWTQVYLHFVDDVLMDYIEDASDAHFQRSAYNGNLLARAEVIWKWPKPRLPRKLIRQDLNEYLAEHGERVTRRMHERMQGKYQRHSAQDGPGVRRVAGSGDCYVKPVGRAGAAAAAWIVEVLPSGETGRIVMENFVPSPEATAPLKECLLRMRFAPHAGHQPILVRVPMVMGSRQGASIRGRRR